MGYNALGIIKLLFLSDQDSHTKIFQKIIEELRNMSNGIEKKILNSYDLYPRPLSIMIPCRQEFQHFTKIIKKFQPDILIVANDQDIKTIFIRICNLMQIPSLAIQDGILFKKKLNGFLAFLALKKDLPWRIISTITNIPVISKLHIRLGFKIFGFGWGTGGSTMIAAMGNYAEEFLLSKGISPDKIVVTGYTLLDELPESYTQGDKSSILRDFSIDQGRPLVLWLTQPFVEDRIIKAKDREALVSSVLSAISGTSMQLIIKLHPRESLREYIKIVSELDKSNTVIVKDYDLDALVASSDVVLTSYSTAGLLAILYNKQLVVLDFFPIPVENIYSQGIGIVVKTIEELSDTLSDIIKNPNNKNIYDDKNDFIYNHLYKLDGRASKRIAQLILNLTYTRK